jgi:hypothetical protein
VAGYEDSVRTGDQRAADRALRLAVIQRLGAMRARLEEAVRQCNVRGATSHIASVERAIDHLDRVMERFRASDRRIEASYDEAKVGSERASFLHAAHLAIFEQAEAMVRHFDEPDIHHDRMPHLQADLRELEHRLDEKVAIYRKLN